MNELKDIIEQQMALQHRLGYRFDELPNARKIEYIKEMILATQMELGEALNEVSWKSWASGTQINVDLYTKELVDVLHFVINLFLVVYPYASAQELATMICDLYTRKNKINHQRQDAGYDATTTKCYRCGRAREDQVLTEVRLIHDTVRLCTCEAVLDVIPNIVADAT